MKGETGWVRCGEITATQMHSTKWEALALCIKGTYLQEPAAAAGHGEVCEGELRRSVPRYELEQLPVVIEFLLSNCDKKEAATSQPA